MENIIIILIITIYGIYKLVDRICEAVETSIMSQEESDEIQTIEMLIEQNRELHKQFFLDDLN